MNLVVERQMKMAKYMAGLENQLKNLENTSFSDDDVILKCLSDQEELVEFDNALKKSSEMASKFVS